MTDREELTREAREVFLLTLKKLKDRLASDQPLTGAELQAALRFLADNGLSLQGEDLFDPPAEEPETKRYPFPVEEDPQDDYGSIGPEEKQ